jgi:hypothetical protein
VLQPGMGKQSNRNFTKNETWFRLQPSFVFAYFYSMLRAFLQKKATRTQDRNGVVAVNCNNRENRGAFNLGSTLLINVYRSMKLSSVMPYIY